MSTALIRNRLHVPACKIDKHTSTSDFKCVVSLSDVSDNCMSVPRSVSQYWNH